jgi:hypothetical protein
VARPDEIGTAVWAEQPVVAQRAVVVTSDYYLIQFYMIKIKIDHVDS